jgi:hypothetical protein
LKDKIFGTKELREGLQGESDEVEEFEEVEEEKYAQELP